MIVCTSSRYSSPARAALLISTLLASASPLSAQGVVNTSLRNPAATATSRSAIAAAKDGESPTAECVKNFENQKKQSVESFGCYWGRLRLNSSDDADVFFGGLEIGNSIALRVGDEQTSLYTELLGDNLYLSSRLGYARLGFATIVAAAQDSVGNVQRSTVDQFFQGGGNAVLYAALPSIVWINFAVDTAKGPIRQLNSFATLALTGDIPKLGTAVQETAGSVRAGFQTDFTWRTHNERFGLFFNLRASYVRGLSDAFYRNLLGTDAGVESWGLLAGDYTVGVDLSKLIRVGVSGGVSTNSAIVSKARLSVQLLKQK